MPKFLFSEVEVLRLETNMNFQRNPVQIDILDTEQAESYYSRIKTYLEASIIIKHIKDYFNDHLDFPGPSYQLIDFFGEILNMNKQGTLRRLEELVNQYGPIFKFKLFDKKVLMISDPNISNALLNQQKKIQFYKNHHGLANIESRYESITQGVFWNALRQHFGGGNFAGGDDWYQQKLEIMHGLREDLNHFKSVMQDTILDCFTQQTPLETRFNLIPYMKDLAFDIIGRVALGDSFREQGKELRDAFEVVLQYLEHFAIIEQPWLRSLLEKTSFLWAKGENVATYQDLERAFNNIENIVRKVINDYLEQRLLQRPLPKNYFTSLLYKLNIDDELFIEDEMYQQETIKSVAARFAIFFFAGHETTSKVMAWLSYELACKPQLAEEIRSQIIEASDELKNHGYYGQKLNIDEIVKKVPLLNATMKEALRKYSPAAFEPRESNKDIIITTDETQYIIPKNTPILFSPVLQHHYPDIWQEPESFNPYRFMNKLSRQQKEAYRPFSTGSHKCPGDIFSNHEITTYMVHFLLSFDAYKITREEDISLDIKGTLNPIQALEISLTQRVIGYGEPDPNQELFMTNI